MKIHKPATLLALICILAGCSENEEMRALKSRANKLEQSNEKLSQELTLLRDKAGPNAEEFSAYMQKGDEGYSRLRFDLGTLLVTIGQIRGHERGTEVIFNIGNLTAANITRLKADIKWGTIDNDGYPENREANLRQVEINKYLPAGAWTAASVVLDGVKPESVEFIRLKDVLHRTVELQHKGSV
jgi:outer membrane murein-binding lipoprotein Lpp